MTATQKELFTLAITATLALFTVGYLARKAASSTVEAVANVNAGTPYEGSGVVGTLGNVTNRASGGFLADVGSAIGEFFSGPLFDKRTVDDLTSGE